MASSSSPYLPEEEIHSFEKGLGVKPAPRTFSSTGVSSALNWSIVAWTDLSCIEGFHSLHWGGPSFIPPLWA